MARYFGMMHPEGFRKTMRVMRLAERQGLPIITLINTPGAYPGVGAEERGQFEAIARNIMDMFSLRTPIIGAILGEGFSGGAIGIGVVDYLMIFEHAVYSVCTPEACAAIILRDDTKNREAAEALKFTTKDHLELQIIDE